LPTSCSRNTPITFLSTLRPSFAWQGVKLDRSTLADWVGKAAFLLRPVHAWLFERLKASGKHSADETTAPVLNPGSGRTKTGQLFAYARDDRPWGGSDPLGVAYLYAPDRKAERLIRHLQGVAGTLQVDGYAGYKILAERNAVSLVFCWSHARRKFYEISQSGLAPIATEALARIAALHQVEADIRRCSAQECRAALQASSRPIVAALEPWLKEKLGLVSQKSKLAEAIRYALSRWQGLTRFLDDGRVEIESNVVERAIRPIAFNRKNALFAGSDGGGEHWAFIASLVETCKLNAIDPQANLGDVIARIVAGHPQNPIGDLLPWAYAPQQLKAVA
jgi:transposase